MKIAIKTFHEQDLASVVRLYNELVVEIPVNWSVTEAEFSNEVMGKGQLYNPSFPFEPDSRDLTCRPTGANPQALKVACRTRDSSPRVS